MKLIRTLIALAIMFCASQVSAQAPSVTPGFQALNIHNGYGHCIYPVSFTFKGSVDLGNQMTLLRTVERKEFGSWNSYAEDQSLMQMINTSGMDQFTIYFPNASAVSWDVRVHYRYVVDPDGNGPLNVGDDAVMVQVNTIQPQPPITLTVSQMQIVGFYLNMQVQGSRYVGGSAYDAELVLEVRNSSTGLVIWYDSTSINPAGSPIFTQTYSGVYLPLVAPGNLCATARIRYTHDGPGFNDFLGVLVAQTAGNNCEYWPGLSTDVPDFDFVGNEIVSREEGVLVITDIAGRVALVGKSSRASTTGLSEGTYIATLITSDGQKRSHKFLVTH